jgi:hypothetical protein
MLEKKAEGAFLIEVDHLRCMINLIETLKLMSKD